MPRTSPRPEPLTGTRTPRVRLAGVSAGAVGLGCAWLGGLAVSQLTGATPVLIVLAAGFVLWPLATWGAWRAVRPVRVVRMGLPPASTAGSAVDAHVDLDGVTTPVWLEIRRGATVGSAWWRPGEPVPVTFAQRGEVVALEVAVKTAGRLGLVWWRRTERVPVAHLVAPAPVLGDVWVERTWSPREGDRPGAAGAVAGDADGVRPWREGDSERAVHWATSLRAGELVVHDRRRPADRSAVVRAMPGRPDPDAEAGAARWALEASLAAGDETWAAVGDDLPVRVADAGDAAHWSATVPLGGEPQRAHRSDGWWARLRRPPQWRAEPEQTARPAARWWAAAATLVAVAMLCSSLGYGPAIQVPAMLGILAGAFVTARTIATSAPLPGWTRAVAGFGALAALAGVVASIGPFNGLFGVLRGPLPQLLVVLIVLHGFECRDRRTIRVSLGISGVVLMYASGFRVDATIAWWLLAWGLCAGVALGRLAGPTQRPPTPAWPVRPRVAWVRPAGLGAVGVAATIGVLAAVPIPAGPARLTLPTLIDRELPVGGAGAIAGPDGTVRPSGDTGSTERSRSPQAGDYTGFAEALDTNVRGELGDQVVMRVRAAAPDFWRGQTFSTFDGRIWYADEDPGTFHRGPQIGVAPAFGDRRSGGRYELGSDEFLQTFFVEADMPNVVFHAYRPSEVIVDADLFERPDGALRASTSFAAGSIYTVVSQRRDVTAQALRASGHVADRLTELGREAFARYLVVPESTSPGTVELAGQLAAGQPSTYDVVRAYEAWLGAHVEYDLYAPLPPEGTDAVHDLLFGSRRGFCEQIASALVIMLRTQGVPARLATGYVAGTRDRVAGVWEVRASDAHAWAEVWFPEVGWQAFDPTASVPLAGDSRLGSVGAELLSGAGRWTAAHPGQAAIAVAVPVCAVLSWRLIAGWRRRRRRGRWGLLQDRFAALAGAPYGATNPQRAAAWTDSDARSDAAATAREVARRLDASGFDPTWREADADFPGTRKLVEGLPRPRR